MAIRMSSPVKGRVTSEYGMRNGTLHAGIDISTDGKPGNVHATFAGTVERVVKGRKHGNRRTDSYAPGRTGNYVVVRNPDRERQLYNHTDASVQVGDNVAIGSVLGKTDLSGNTTGYHCHYEEWTSSGRTRNPRISFEAFDVAPGSTPVAVKDTPSDFVGSDDVRELQRALNRFKATPDKRWPNGDLLVDGIYGPYTTARVKDLQIRNGLFVDGIAGPKTRRFLGI